MSSENAGCHQNILCTYNLLHHCIVFAEHLILQNIFAIFWSTLEKLLLEIQFFNVALPNQVFLNKPQLYLLRVHTQLLNLTYDLLF